MIAKAISFFLKLSSFEGKSDFLLFLSIDNQKKILRSQVQRWKDRNRIVSIASFLRYFVHKHENFFLKPLEIKEKMYGINRISEYQTISTEYILPSLMRIASGFASP